MNMEEHFEGETPYITLDSHTPMANSKPIHNTFMSKHVRKKLKETGYTSNQHMNVIFERSKPLRVGDSYTWKLREMEFNVVVLGKTELFVRGMKVYAYCVGIIE